MYKAPSLEALSRNVRQAFRAEVPGTDPWVWPNTLYVIGKVFAGLMRALYQRLEFVHRQARVVTASGEYLDLHGADIGVTRKTAAYAAGQATFTTDLVNAVPAGARLLRADDAVFVVDATVVPAASPSTVNLRAAEPGTAWNTEGLAPLTLETPIAGASAFAVTAAGLTGGADDETDASYRARILEKKRNPPHGGSPGEYISWAREVAGVTRVFVQRATPQAGSVTVLFMMDDSIYANGIPAAGDVTTVQAHLNAAAPASADVIAAAPTPVAVNVTLSALSPNTASVQESIRRELRAMFRRRAEPGTPTANFVFSKSWISEAISIATGEGSHTLTAPAGDTNCTNGQIATLGTVTFP